MRKKEGAKWKTNYRINQILFAFSTPKTPSQVEKELSIPKLKLKYFTDKGLLIPLNPLAKKGRFYTVADETRNLLDLPQYNYTKYYNWDLIGRLVSSPKQKLVVLRAMDSAKRTSENIRERASRYNPHLSRVSTKAILRDLIRDSLVKTEMENRYRLYWISQKGHTIRDDINELWSDS